MKVFVVLLLVLLAAATAFAYGNLAVTSNVTSAAVQVAEGTSEPAALLLSGSFLLGLAAAVKRFHPLRSEANPRAGRRATAV